VKVNFKAIHGQVPANVEEALFQAANLESRQLQYQKSTECLADRAAQAQLKEEMLQVKFVADEKHKSIGNLQVSCAELKQKIADLSAKREALLAKLKQVKEALTQAKQEKS